MQCPNCGNIVDDANSAFCPHCGEKMPEQKAVGDVISNSIDRHVDNRNQSDNSIHNNTTNNQTVIHNTTYVSQKAEPEMSREEIEEAYKLERELLRKRLEKGNLETFIEEEYNVKADKKTGKISRVEAGRRLKLIGDMKDEFSRKQQAAARTYAAPSHDVERPVVTTRPANPQIPSAPAARPVQAPKPLPRPVQAPVSNTTSSQTQRSSSPVSVSEQSLSGSKQSSSFVKYLIGAAVIGGVIWMWKGGSDSDAVPSDEVAVEQTEEMQEGAQEGQAAQGAQASYQAPRKTQSAPLPQTSQPASATQETQSEQPVQSAGTAPQAEPVASDQVPAQSSSMSASDLVASGKKAMRSFNYAKALSDLQKATSMGSTEAYYQLGVLYSSNNYEGYNKATAISYFEKAANSGIVDAMYQIGKLNVGKDNDTAKQWLTKAANKGHAQATALLNNLK